jgi:hypothetical protein
MDYARMGAVGIYTDVQPYSDHVQHANDGLLLPNNPAVWVKSILELADNSALRAEMQLAVQTSCSGRPRQGEDDSLMGDFGNLDDASWTW